MKHSNLHIIVGLGVTGFSCARYLTSQAIPFAVADTRANPPQLDAFKKEFPDAVISLGKFDEAFLSQAATIILSPGVALREPAIAAQVQRGIPVIGDIELFAQAVTAPVIAITGTNAKSTVTTLVGEMVQAAGYQVQVGGNLGVPVLDLLMQNPKASVFVLELSSFQLETTFSLKPKVATVLNVTPDHMDRYDSVQAYQQAKLRVYHDCQIAVCNKDDALTDCTDTSIKRKINFTLQAPSKDEFGLITKDNAVYLAYGDQLLLPIKELPVMGKHYQANALAALALGYGFGLPFEPMIKVLKEFKGLPHRCHLVRERHQVRWYNDSKGTNVGATQAAIEGLGSEIQGKLILIAGGVGKSANFDAIVPVIEKFTRHVVLIGEAADDIAAAIGCRVPISFAHSMEEAVQQCDAEAQANDSVLLSPACASFDMFNNYEHRGKVFTEMVERL